SDGLGLQARSRVKLTSHRHHETYANARSARSDQGLAGASGTSTHSFIGRPFMRSKDSTPVSARARSRSSGPSLNVIASPNVPANTLSPAFRTGIPNI